MSSPKKQPDRRKPPAAPPRPSKPAAKPLPAWAEVALCLLAIYLMLVLIFPKQLLDGYDFAFGGDNLAAAPIARMGEDFQQEGAVPDWCPYIMGGLPTVGSLIYANHYSWGFQLGKRLSFLFFGSNYAWLFLHYLFASLGVFLVLRFLRVHWAIAALAGIFFAFNPSMVVFADVGHGSKLMTMAYLPWILYFTMRLYERPDATLAAALALAFGFQLRALHVQIAYYGAMLMGLYAVYALAVGWRSDRARALKATALLAIAGLVAFGLSAPLYLQVAEYSDYSIRGGGATGGASWEYATAWSFHPLESLTYIFPSFFGFGGQTYWGFMPFTDMPLYWGGVILLFAPWALVLRRDRAAWFLLILAGLAWIVSFGKFLPLLYGPLFSLLPYFNKFRVPSLIQVLVLLPAVVLAGVALQAIWETAITGGDRARILARRFLRAGGIVAGICVLLLALQAALRPMFMAWIAAARPQLQSTGASQAFSLFTGDVLRLLVLTIALYGVAILVLQKRLIVWALAAVVALAAALELSHFDRRLNHPTPPSQMENYLAATPAVRFQQDQPEPFRLFPLTSRNPNWYMPQRLESILGYTGAKTRLYQEAVDSLSYNNISFLRMMNVQYLVSEQPIVHDDFEEVFSGGGERVARYKRALPRAFLVSRSVTATPGEILNLYRAGNFDFASAAALEAPPSASLDEGARGQLIWADHSPDHLALEVQSSGKQLLVIGDVYYPSGWQAMLDGVEVPILKTNYLFRGVEIPAGSHRVEMTFEPRTKSLGRRLMWISLALILAAGLFTFAAGWRKPRESSGGV